ncbi:MAG: type II toxin-antitoxin system RelE/ParE family toxin [Nitrospira sp.]|nr:type II toxin-antitoxin system RelE/ParE family toxin [Nitrospira sp.]
MIVSFLHKGLRLLFEEDDGRKLHPDLRNRLRLILSALNAAERAEDLNQPTFRLHPLKGDRAGRWAVTVRANRRVTFRFLESHVHDVDLEDYH